MRRAGPTGGGRRRGPRGPPTASPANPFVPMPSRSPPRAIPGPRASHSSHAAGARKPHVCFLAPTTWPVISRDCDIRVVGGAEVQQSMIAPALARRGYRVSMICLDYGQPDRTEIAGVTIYNMHKPHERIPELRFVHAPTTS